MNIFQRNFTSFQDALNVSFSDNYRTQRKEAYDMFEKRRLDINENELYYIVISVNVGGCNGWFSNTNCDMGFPNQFPSPPISFDGINIPGCNFGVPGPFGPSFNNPCNKNYTRSHNFNGTISFSPND
jgi:hypothetical protein